MTALSPAELRAAFREQARREVAEHAPKIARDTDIAVDIKALCADFPDFVKQRRRQQEPGTAA